MSELGKVTRVQLNGDNAPIEVDVNLSYTKEREEIPFRSPSPGTWFVPSVGDVVEVTEIGSGRHIAHSPLQSPAFRLPDDATQGDVIIKTGQDTTLRIDQDGDITVEASGDLNLKATNIYADGERLATESHTHDHEDDDGSTTTTKTTDPANNDGLT